MAKYQKYAEYQDSGLEWLGGIPDHWEVKKLKYLGEAIIGLTYSPDDVVDNETVGTLVLRSSNVQNKKLAFDDNVYVRKEIPKKLRTQKDDILICARNGSRALIGKNALIDDSATGITFGAFMSIFRSPYNTYLSNVFNSALFEYQSGTFLTATINQLTTGNLNSFEVPFPPKAERDVIAHFLDHETAKIDSLIEKQQQLIELLKEKRQAVISHAVTKGLDPSVKMKDSGVEWLGEVPEHWNMAPVRRYLLEHRQGYYTTESYVDEGLKLLRITDLRDLGEINVANCPMVNESDTTHLFKLRKGDVVFARTGGAGSFGVITEDYENLIYASYLIRFRFMSKIFEPDYLKFLFQSDSFQLSVKQNIHGGVNQNIHAEDIKNTVVCAPSLLEQKKIVEYLEYQCLLFEDLINKASDSVKLMQERRTALISAAVTGKIDVRNWQNPSDTKTELSV